MREALLLLRERIKSRRDSRYDNQMIELLDILIAETEHSKSTDGSSNG